VTPEEFRRAISFVRHINLLIRQLPDEAASDFDAMLPKLADDIGKLMNRFPHDAFPLSFEEKTKVVSHSIEIGRCAIQALNLELEKSEFEDIEAAPDFEYIRERLQALQDAAVSRNRDCVVHGLSMIRRSLQCLRDAAKRIGDDEKGRGPPPDRAAMELSRGLRLIFCERTGKAPSKSLSGSWAAFVRAVNGLIPNEVPLARLDHLIVAAAQ